jgi:hypothetical protein
MTHRQYTDRIALLGYTAREASFLATATLNSGYFIRRQYNPLTRGTGAATARFCEKLTKRRHAKPAAIGKCFLYRIQGKDVYEALGVTESRYRHPGSFFSVPSKLMSLDFVLAHPSYEFVPIVEAERIAYFAQQRGVSKELFAIREGPYAHYFLERFPIGVDSVTNRMVFAYVDDNLFTMPGFQKWLELYGPLIQAIGEADVAYVCRSDVAFTTARRQFQRAFPAQNGEMDAVLELYFETRKDIETHGIGYRKPAELDEYRRLMSRFSSPRYESDYLNWLERPPTQDVPATGIRLTTFRPKYNYDFLGDLDKDIRPA